MNRNPTSKHASVCALAALLVAAFVAVLVLAPGPATPSGPEPSSPPPAKSSEFSRPADWSPHRPAVHLTPPSTG
ncbi:hypothetical protein ACFSHR_06055 [Azotobacter chroococcum]